MNFQNARIIGLLMALAVPAAFAENFIGIGSPAPSGKFGLISYQNFINGPSNDANVSSVFPISYVTVTPTYYTERGFTKARDLFQIYAGAAVGYINGLPPGATASTADRIGWGLPHLGLQWYFNAVRETPISHKPGAAKAVWWFSPYAMVYLPNGSTRAYKNSPYGFDGVFGNRVQFSIGLQNEISVGSFTFTIMPAQFNYSGPYLHMLGAPGNTESLDIDIMDSSIGYAIHRTFYVGIHHVYTLKNVTGSGSVTGTPVSYGEGRIGPSFTWLGLASKGLYVFANVNFTYATGNPATTPKTTSLNGCILYLF